MEKIIKVLFVCTGNICRSPTAEAVFRNIVKNKGLEDKIIVESAGISAYHVGEPPDSRAVSYARTRGIDMSGIKAQKFTKEAFQDFDIILAMDHTHHHTIYGMRPNSDELPRAKLFLFLDLAKDIKNKDVPDPYYGGEEGFKKVFDLIDMGSNCLFDYICSEYFK